MIFNISILRGKRWILARQLEALIKIDDSKIC